MRCFEDQRWIEDPRWLKDQRWLQHGLTISGDLHDKTAETATDVSLSFWPKAVCRAGA